MAKTVKTLTTQAKLRKPPLKAYRLAVYMATQITGYYPRLKSLRPEELAKTIPQWSEDIAKIHRIDGKAEGVDPKCYTYTAISRVLNWAMTDHFWRQNIKSGDKFRKQYDTLIMRMIDSRYRGYERLVAKRKVTKV